MKSDATSLDRLHDIVEPAPIPWWPPAPGWYVVSAVIALTIAWLAVRWWSSWKANAYRRTALKELVDLQDSSAIAELLRRTALATHPRSEIANLNGESWTAWLCEQSQTEMPPRVRETLKVGIYSDKPDSDSNDLKAYASEWIALHKSPMKGEASC